MAKNDNLKDFVTDIADTLRTLTQTSEPINPQDFTTKMHDIKENLDAELNEQDTLLAELQSAVDELPNQIDLSSTTATEEDVLQGKEFFNASGEKVSGIYKDMLQERIDLDKSCDYLFYYYGGESLPFIKKLDTSQVTSMSHTFADCKNLTSIDLSSFNTSKVKKMEYLVYNCYALTSIDLSGFDTSQVTTMEYMFGNCKNLTSIDLSGFDTSKLTNMRVMFNGCENLTSIDLSSFDTSKVTNMGSTFMNCSKLKNIIGILDCISLSSGSTIAPFSGNKELETFTLKNIRYTGSISSVNLATLDTLLNTIKELWINTTTSTRKWTVGTTNLEKLANVYVKLIDITDEMRAEDEYIDNKAPFVVCESTDEGAMLITEYVTTVKNWQIA